MGFNSGFKGLIFNPLNTQLNLICHLLALLGAHPILHVSRIRVKTLTNILKICPPEHNERTSTEFNLVTAQSTAHEPPENGRKYVPKHVGASF